MAGDEAALQGVWVITSLEVEGSAMSGVAFDGSKIIMEGDRFTTVAMGGAYSGNFSVDSAPRPKTLDPTFTEGPHAGSKALAVYALDGDTLTLCIGFAGAARPASFETTPGSGHALETMKRETSVVGNRAEAAHGPTLARSPAAGGTATERPTAGSADPSSLADLVVPDQAAFAEEIARLQGEWSMVSGAMGGQPFPPQFAPTGRREVRGDVVTVSFAGQEYLRAVFAIDPRNSPKSMDYTLLAGASVGMAQLGIYEVSGETLRVCSSPPGQPRPAAFESSADSGCILSEWKRIA